MTLMEQALDMPLRSLIPEMNGQTHRTSYCGVPMVKAPFDLWSYREILWETEPDYVVEIGNYCGGSLLAIAHMLDVIGHGEVIGLDVSHAAVPRIVSRHPRITLVTGDAIHSVPKVREIVKSTRCMVIDDSSHEYDHTLAVLEAFSPFVGTGFYFVVEDGICHHGLPDGPSPGPYEACRAFLAAHPEWEADRSRERFILTWNPGGYLRRSA